MNAFCSSIEAEDLVNVDVFVQVDSTVTEKRRQNCQMLVTGIKSEMSA